MSTFKLSKNLAEHFQNLPTYSGWINKPTWALALHINNNEYWYQLWQARARALIKNPPPDLTKTPEATRIRHQLEDELQAWAESLIENPGHKPHELLAADLTLWALAYVCWQQLADSILET